MFIKDWYYEIKFFIQRGVRGYSNRDLWDLGDHLMMMIPPAIRQLSEGTSGCPGDLWDKDAKNNECHKWNEILEEIAQGFEAAQQIKDMRRYCKWLKTPEGLYDHELEKDKDKQLAEKYERGMELFAKYFLNLWD